VNTIAIRCRGCDYVAEGESMSFQGHDIGIHLTGGRCPQCGGRMQGLSLERLQPGYVRVGD
jgi:hypothetical protein